MTSTLVLAAARTRVRELLVDAAPGAVWPDAQVDAGLRQALEEYSRASLMDNSPIPARKVIGAVTPALDAREVDLSALTPALLELDRVWYPYDAALGADPTWIAFELWWNDGSPLLFLADTVGNGSSVARLFYSALHALNGLDGAAATTFTQRDENLLALGAAGFACLMRSVDLNENATNMAVSTPNYGALADMLLSQFRAAFTPRRTARVMEAQGRSPLGTGYYDPDLLEWVGG